MLWHLSRAGNPSPFPGRVSTLTILTLRAEKLLLRHRLQAQTLHVKDAAALALAGHQRLARAFTDLKTSRQPVREQRVPDVPKHDWLRDVGRIEMGWKLFRATVSQKCPTSHSRPDKTYELEAIPAVPVSRYGLDITPEHVAELMNYFQSRVLKASIFWDV